MKLLLCSNFHADPNFKMMMDDPEQQFKKELAHMWEPHIMKSYYEDFMKGAYYPGDGYILEIEESNDCHVHTTYTEYQGNIIRHICVPTGYGPDDCLWKPDKVACIVVHGGNTFNISSELHRTGWYEFIFDKVFNHNIPYIGYSAGAIMATPFILSAMWADTLSAHVLKDVNNLCGFGFVDFFIKPHDEGYMPMPRYVKQFKDFSEIFGHDFYSIGEYGAVLIDGESQVVSDVTEVSKINI